MIDERRVRVVDQIGATRKCPVDRTVAATIPSSSGAALSLEREPGLACRLRPRRHFGAGAICEIHVTFLYFATNSAKSFLQGAATYFST